jgi:hypothetical protein
MEPIMERISLPARKVYGAMCQLQDRNKICKASQRELVAATSMAFKTIIPARDELLRMGLLEVVGKGRGNRPDWHRVIPAESLDREVARVAREAERRRTVERARRDRDVVLELDFAEAQR